MLRLTSVALGCFRAALVAVVFLPGSAFAQSFTGTLSGIGGGRRIQFRWEMYNVPNQVNWSAINSTAQFNPAGEQVNLNFGKATASRSPRVMQGALRFTF